MKTDALTVHAMSVTLVGRNLTLVNTRDNSCD